MKNRKILSVLFGVIAVLMFVLSGCGKKEVKADTNGTPTKEKQKVIAGIIFQDDQFFHLVSYGMEDAAKKAGAEFLLGNSNLKPDEETELVNTYIDKGVDAIVISPLNRKNSMTPLRRAREKGITVVTYNSTVDGDIAEAFVESDQFNIGVQTGKAAREFIEKNLNDKANIGILAFKANVLEQSNARTDGFKSEINKLSGVKIVEEQDAWLAETAIKKAGDILTAHPEIDILYAANEGGTVGAVTAVKNAGKAGKVFVFGTDVSTQLLEFLESKDNILQAITGQKSYKIGQIAVNDALDILEGHNVESKTTISGVLLDRSQPRLIDKYKRELADLKGNR